MLYRYSFDSPVGCLRLEEEDGYLTGVHFEQEPSVRYADDTDLLRQTEQQLTEYFAGSRTDFSIPLKLQGTDFQKRVWRVVIILFKRNISAHQSTVFLFGGLILPIL